MGSVGSLEQSPLPFGLSAPRFAIVFLFFLLGSFLLFCAVRPLVKQSKQDDLENKMMESQKDLWLAFFCGLFAAAIGFALLTRKMDFFGDWKFVYQQLEPVFVWVVVLGLQTTFFAAVWYCAKYIQSNAAESVKDLNKELLSIFALFFGFVIVKLVFISSFGPLGRGDEMTYFDMAESLYRGFFSPRDSNHYPPLYPLSLVGTLVFKAWTFEGIKILNAVLSSSLVFPVYLLARLHVNSKNAFIAAFLSCLIPFHLVFPRRILSENLFFPLFLWAMLVTYAQPKNPRYRLFWDVVNGALIAGLFLTRYITLATIPFFILCWWIKPFTGEKGLFNPGLKKLTHFFIFIAAMLLTFSPWLFAGMREGVPLNLLLGFGITSRTTQAQLTFPRLLEWVLLYACYFILVAAPVFHLLIVSIWQFEKKNWREGFNRLIIQVLALMAGFYAAVTRHSWRAFYNAELPTAIMGRYLIVFSALYFVIAVIAVDHFKPSNFKSSRHFILITQVIPFALVSFAYLTLIEGAVVPTDGDLLKSLGSVDAFFTEILGPFFFVLLFFLYGATNWIMFKGDRWTSVKVLVVGLIIYYAIGAPAYNREILNFQTYPYLAKQISHMLPPPDLKSGESDRVTVFLPEERTVRSGAEIYNGLRINGFPETIIEAYSEEAVEGMTTKKGFIIVSLPAAMAREDLPVFEINEMQFQIIEISK
jgi:hypothetical protein